jgi:hypothetical protein
MVFIDMKIKGVVGVFGIVRMTRLGFCPGDDFAHILDDGFALANVLHCKHAFAMHAGAPDLDATAPRGIVCSLLLFWHVREKNLVW